MAETAAGWKRSPGYKLWKQAVAAGKRGEHPFGDFRKSKRDEEKVTLPEDLMREHGIFRRAIGILSHMAEGEIKKEIVEYCVADVIQKYIERIHEVVEDEYIFPYFLEAGKEVELVEQLTHQHHIGRLMSFAMLSNSMLKNSDSGEISSLIKEYGRMFTAHGVREDTSIFPYISEVMEPREINEALETLFSKEFDTFGKHASDALTKNLAEIEHYLDIADIQVFAPNLSIEPRPQ